MCTLLELYTRLLQNIFKKWFGEAWTGLIWLRIETADGFFVKAVINLWVP
jgi:hypothetical protein